MPSDDSERISELWRNATQELAQVQAERQCGANGSGGGDDSARPSFDCPVAYPSDWDPREYAEWSDSVNASHTSTKSTSENGDKEARHG